MANSNSTVTLTFLVNNQGATALTGATQGVQTLGTAIGGVTKNLGELRGVAQNVFEGAGMGVFGRLAGLAGGAAALATAGLVIGQAMRMAYEFERVSTRAAQVLNIGTGVGLGSAISTVQGAAYGQQRYGYDAGTMAAAVAALSGSSGLPIWQVRGAATTIAQYSRAYGLDPSVTATMVGGLMAYTGETAGSSASGLFGGMERGGRLGRQPTTYAAVVQGTLASLEAGDPTRDWSRGGTARAAGYVNAIANLGGFYATPQGVNAVAGGLTALTQGGNADIRRAVFAQRAGVSLSDITLGTNTPEIQAKEFRSLLHTYGHGNVNDIIFQYALTNLVGQDSARALVGAYKAGPNFIDNIKKSAPGAPLEKRLADAMDTPLSTIDQSIAALKNEMTQQGEKGLHFLTSVLGHGDITDKLETLIHLGEITIGVIVGGNLLQKGFGLGKGLLKWLGGIGPEAAAAAEGIEGVTMGGIAGAVAPFTLPFLLSGDSGPGGVTPDKNAPPGSPARIAWERRQNLVFKSSFGTSINPAGARSDLLSANVTHPELIMMLRNAQNFGRLGISAVHTDHPTGDSLTAHAGGWAADITSVGGVPTYGRFQSTIQRFLLSEVARDPFLNGLGLPPAYYGANDPQLTAAIKARGLHTWQEPDSHIHMNAGPAVQLDNRTPYKLKVTLEATPQPGTAGSRTSGANRQRPR